MIGGWRTLFSGFNSATTPQATETIPHSHPLSSDVSSTRVDKFVRCDLVGLMNQLRGCELILDDGNYSLLRAWLRLTRQWG